VAILLKKKRIWSEKEMNIINKIHGVISEPTKQKEENQVIWARAIAATILNVIVIGALSSIYKGQPDHLVSDSYRYD
jgi:ethanolamine utilization protein EutA (predicted chaperonin)